MAGQLEQIAQLRLALRADPDMAFDNLARDAVGRPVDDLLEHRVRRMLVDLAGERSRRGGDRLLTL